MATRYVSHDTEDNLATQNSPPLYLAPQEHPMLEGHNESSDEYCEETDTHPPLDELLEQFCQLKNPFTSLKSTTPQSTSRAELTQLRDKLQHLTMTLQLPSLGRKQCTKPCRYTQTPCIPHRLNQTSQ